MSGQDDCLRINVWMLTKRLRRWVTKAISKNSFMTAYNQDRLISTYLTSLTRNGGQKCS